jgi:SHS2 domain-containing protein
VTGHFEVLEHTADVGLRLRGATLEEVFEAAGEGFATLQDAWFPPAGESRRLRVTAEDLGGLLVAWLDELLYLHESEDLVFGGLNVESAAELELRAFVTVAPRGDRVLEGVGIKATTYHRLRFERSGGGWIADVYLDV